MHLKHMPSKPAGPTIDFDAFLAVDIRVGTVVAGTLSRGAQVCPEAHDPLRAGDRAQALQRTDHCTPADLVGRQVAAVVNFPPRQIGTFLSEVLTLGFGDEAGAVVLFQPDKSVPDGSRLF